MVQKKMGVKDSIYDRVTKYKGKYMSYSDVVEMLVNSHEKLLRQG